MPRLLTLSQAAKVLDLDRFAVGLIAKRLGLPDRPVPGLPNSRGLLEAEVSIISDRLRPIEPPQPVPVPA